MLVPPICTGTPWTIALPCRNGGLAVELTRLPTARIAAQCRRRMLVSDLERNLCQVRLAVQSEAGRCALLLVTVPTGSLPPAPAFDGNMTDATALLTARTTLAAHYAPGAGYSLRASRDSAAINRGSGRDTSAASPIASNIRMNPNIESTSYWRWPCLAERGSAWWLLCQPSPLVRIATTQLLRLSSPV